jgi:nitrile hydratase subunit beta
MDGIHDVGGEQGFGRVEPTAEEPPFKQDWEARLVGIFRTITRLREADWNPDKFRFTREQLPPEEYLTRPYFDQWYRTYAAMLLGSGLVTAEELATGRSTQSVPTFHKPMSAADVATASKATERFDRPYAGERRFAVGDRVRAVLRAQPGHTRLPRYVRGHVGMVVAAHGAQLFPTRARKAVLSPSLSIRSPLRWPSYFPSGQAPPTKFISTCGSGTLSGSNRLEPLADELRPVFNEPWQAEAYALVQVLIETGRISSSQWAKAFGAALWEAAGQGEPDGSDTYYSTLSETLQRVLVAGGRVHDAEIRQRIDDWRAAYRRTPHGKPVRLKEAQDR